MMFTRTVGMRILWAILLAIAALTLASCGKSYARDDFQKLVINKTAAQVEATLGKPDWEDDFDPKMWTYRSATFDPSNNGKKDEKALLVFGKAGTPDTDKVVEVRFE